MKKQIITVLSVIAFIGGFFLLYFSGTKQLVTPAVSQTTEQTATSEHWVQKIDEQSSVTVIVTPIDILSQSKEWKFDIGMNTHSVELDQDMTKIAVLVDDQGKEYKLLRFESGEAGGHHREGVLVFNQIVPIPKSLELKISGIGDVIRTFVW